MYMMELIIIYMIGLWILIFYKLLSYRIGA